MYGSHLKISYQNYSIIVMNCSFAVVKTNYLTSQDVSFENKTNYDL